MTAVSQTLVLSPTLPPAPLTLASAQFLHDLAQAERDIAHIIIKSPEDAQRAANIQRVLTTAGKTLEDTRKQLKDPFIKAGQMIDEAAKAPANRIDAAKKSVAGKLVAWEMAVRKAAQEAEAARLAELRALEEKRKAEELANAPRAGVEDFDAFDDVPAPKTATAVAIERASVPVVAPKTSGIMYRTRLLHRVVDINKLPAELVVRTANDAAIRAMHCVTWKDGSPLPVCPGVVFEVERTAVTR